MLSFKDRLLRNYQRTHWNVKTYIPQTFGAGRSFAEMPHTAGDGLTGTEMRPSLRHFIQPALPSIHLWPTKCFTPSPWNQCHWDKCSKKTKRSQQSKQTRETQGQLVTSGTVSCRYSSRALGGPSVCRHGCSRRPVLTRDGPVVEGRPMIDGAYFFQHYYKTFLQKIKPLKPQMQRFPNFPISQCSECLVNFSEHS